MSFGKIRKKRSWPAARSVDRSPTPKTWWQSGAHPSEYDLVLGGKDWTDLSTLTDADTPLGYAVRNGQRYFSDEDLNDAMHGRSRMVILTMVEGQPVFLNAAMMSDVMIGETYELMTA